MTAPSVAAALAKRSGGASVPNFSGAKGGVRSDRSAGTDGDKDTVCRGGDAGAAGKVPAVDELLFAAVIAPAHAPLESNSRKSALVALASGRKKQWRFRKPGSTHKARGQGLVW